VAELIGIAPNSAMLDYGDGVDGAARGICVKRVPRWRSS
jgi:hypothetical protein